MIEVVLKNHNYEYDVMQLLLVFFSSEEINFVDKLSNKYYGLINELEVKENKIYIKNTVYDKKTIIHENKISFKNESKIDLFIRNYHKRKIKYTIYDALKTFFKANGSWGILTGMRPVKVVHKYLDNGYSIKEVFSILREKYFVSQEKIKLITSIAIRERKFIYPIDTKKISIYISIPFCITRCFYCSFPSNILKKKKHLLKKYIETLIKEIKEVLESAKKYNLVIDSVYIGGGTPSTLELEDLKILLTKIYELIDFSQVREFTFEAGRPNTITKDKLKLLKEFNVDRICLNPQTMDDSLLKEINRDHTVKDILDTYELIKSFSFNSVNMDLIIGLPNQKLKTFKNTLNKIKKLNPENITVHSLAIKRGSHLSNKGYNFDDITTTENMMNYAYKTLKKDYLPYYMYRQKNIVGNLENVGFCHKNKESLYNIKIIEERNTILAFGAGAVSKIAYPNSDRFDRVPNSKGLEDYLKRVDEMISRKIKVLGKVYE